MVEDATWKKHLFYQPLEPVLRCRYHLTFHMCKLGNELCFVFDIKEGHKINKEHNETPAGDVDTSF